MTQIGASPIRAYLDKITSRQYLPEQERLAFLCLPFEYLKVDSHTNLQKENEFSIYCIFVVSGLVSLQKNLDRKRKIVGFGFPGDAVNLQPGSDPIDYSVLTHGPTTVALVRQSDVTNLVDLYPLVCKALWHDCLVEAAIFREWTLNVGYRRADHRIGHLLLECEKRINNRTNESNVVSYNLPLTQTELATALGLSVVHLNKSLRRLREAELVQISGRTIILKDRDKLVRYVKYDDRYLSRSLSGVADGIDCYGDRIPHRHPMTNWRSHQGLSNGLGVAAVEPYGAFPSGVVSRN